MVQSSRSVPARRSVREHRPEVRLPQVLNAGPPVRVTLWRLLPFHTQVTLVPFATLIDPGLKKLSPTVTEREAASEGRACTPTVAVAAARRTTIARFMARASRSRPPRVNRAPGRSERRGCVPLLAHRESQLPHPPSPSRQNEPAARAS